MNNKNCILMKELPKSERPYEKCYAHGPGVLSNSELIAVLLKTGTKSESALDLSKRLLAAYSGPHMLSDICRASIEELSEIDGIGKVKAITLKCVGELSERIAKETAINNVKLSSPSSIADYFMESMRHLKQEEIRAAFFDTKNHLLREIHLTTGTVNASLITPREIFIKALQFKAVYIVLVHNHPSGDPTPSTDDLMLTTRIKEVGELMSIPLLDHIIIGDNKYQSLKEQGIL